EQIKGAIRERSLLIATTTTPKPLVPDVTQALSDPKHLHPVSKTISVTLLSGEPAGILTEGDLLKLAPGQETVLTNATETTLMTMRVISCKGEPGEVLAGSLITLPVRALQDFDSELRAKLD